MNNNVKCKLPISTLIILCSILGVASTNDWATLRKEMSDMRDRLANNGIAIFMNHTAPIGLAPHIHSQCWVDWLPKEEVKRRAYEQEKRDFGLDVVGVLEQYAIKEEPIENMHELQQSVEELLAIAQWIKTSQGYGNYHLKRWAENLALIRLCRLTINPASSIDDIKEMFNRVDGTSQNLKLRVAILNEEAPHQFSLPFFKTENNASSSLCKQWSSHMQQSVAHYMEIGKSRSQLFSSLRFSDVKFDEPEYAFYIEDALDGSHTFRDAWDKKRHYSLCTSAMDMSLYRDMETLLHYRDAVGEIPLPEHGDVDKMDPFGMSAEMCAYKDLVNTRWREPTKRNSAPHVARVVIRIMRGDLADYLTTNYRRRIAK